MARFGKLRLGTAYETELVCKNEDVMPQRFTVRQPTSPFIRVFNQNPGPVAQGMQAVLRIEIRADKSLNKVQDEFQLLTKSEVYKIAIFAHVLPEEEFDGLQTEAFKLHNRPLLLPSVREQGKDEKKGQPLEATLGKLGKHIDLTAAGASEANETSLSGVKLPKIATGDDAHVELDPNKKIEDFLKGDSPGEEGDDS